MPAACFKPCERPLSTSSSKEVYDVYDVLVESQVFGSAAIEPGRQSQRLLVRSSFLLAMSWRKRAPPKIGIRRGYALLPSPVLCRNLVLVKSHEAWLFPGSVWRLPCPAPVH